jgi:hypothetical protein
LDRGKPENGLQGDVQADRGVGAGRVADVITRGKVAMPIRCFCSSALNAVIRAASLVLTQGWISPEAIAFAMASCLLAALNLLRIPAK